MIYIAIAIPVLVVVLKLFLNYKKWLSSKPVNHKLEWVIMVVSCVPAIIGFSNYSSLDWYFSLPLSALMIAFFIWLFFDSIYNALRGYGVFFTGSDDKDDAISDNFLQSIPKWLQVIIKVGGLIALITLYVIKLK